MGRVGDETGWREREAIYFLIRGFLSYNIVACLMVQSFPSFPLPLSLSLLERRTYRQSDTRQKQKQTETLNKVPFPLLLPFWPNSVSLITSQSHFPCDLPFCLSLPLSNQRQNTFNIPTKLPFKVSILFIPVLWQRSKIIINHFHLYDWNFFLSLSLTLLLSEKLSF